MRQSRRIFLARMGGAALAIQLGSIRALNSMADPLAWQREAKFGMFIHWGPYSVAGVAFGLGLVIGALVLRWSGSEDEAEG